jgi:hypothetical protein
MADKYPLLSIGNVDEAIMFRDILSSKFEPQNLYFIVERRGEWFHVNIMEDEISPDLYSSVYQYAQAVFKEFYE